MAQGRRAEQFQQAVLAEQLDIDADPEPGKERHVVLHGRRVGKAVWLPEEFAWEVLHADGDGGYVNSPSYVGADADDFEEVDRGAIGDVAHALAMGWHPLSKEVL